MCHVSCVMCHISYAIFHVSFILCNVSWVMCHISHVLCLVSRVTIIHSKPDHRELVHSRLAPKKQRSNKTQTIIEKEEGEKSEGMPILEISLLVSFIFVVCHRYIDTHIHTD